MVVSCDHERNVVCLHGGDESILGGLLGGEGLLVGVSERGGDDAYAIAGVGLGDRAAEQVVFVIATQQVLVRKDECLRAGRSAGERIADPLLLLRDGAVVSKSPFTSN